jgi:hypothetical protein
MKIAILGSAPSSLGLAPFGKPDWKIWGCSPGVYPQCPRADAWFELHRWEPGVVGVAASQKPWFSPEYVAWMGLRDPDTCPVWMYEPVPHIPASRALPIEDLKAKYGTYFFTSSISIMLACAIDNILEARGVQASAASDVSRFVGHHTEGEPDVIALYGVDMAASDEYGYQRAGCQYFIQMAAELDIEIYVPPESDLLRPMPVYGICENSWWHIKNTARLRELEGRLGSANAMLEHAKHEAAFLQGAIDDLQYQMLTWGEDRDGTGFSPSITAHGSRIQGAVMALKSPAHEAALQAERDKVAEANAQLADAHAENERLRKRQAAKPKAKRRR